MQRLPNQPFFLARDKQRPYTYRCGLSDLDMMLKRVGCTETYGLHSLRVLGYNLSKRGNGQDITVAHGLWMSAAHTRYERFSMSAVLGIPAGMLGAAPVVPDPSGRPAGRPAERVVRGGQTGAAPVEAALSDAQGDDELVLDLDARFNVDAADDLGGDDDAQDHRAAARREARLAARRIAEAAMRGARHRP